MLQKRREIGVRCGKIKEKERISKKLDFILFNIYSISTYKPVNKRKSSATPTLSARPSL